DHRDAMRNAFRRVGSEDVSAETMAETKARIVEAVAAVASGALLDHEAARRRPDGLGALVPLEKQGYTTIDGGRGTKLEFSAEDALAVGADGCKLLVHYRADHDASAERQRELGAGAAEGGHRDGLPLGRQP